MESEDDLLVRSAKGAWFLPLAAANSEKVAWQSRATRLHAATAGDAVDDRMQPLIRCSDTIVPISSAQREYGSLQRMTTDTSRESAWSDWDVNICLLWCR